MFKCKLFGSLKVAGPRGDEICAGAIGHLKQHAKQLNKEQKLHKQRIFLNISLKGIRIIDQQSRKLEHAHVVHKISYISHDKEDRRTFGYIVSLPEGYHLFAFKAEKNAGIITANLKELFHVVYLKHKHEKQAGIESGAEVQEAKQNEIQGDTEPTEFKDENPYAVPKKFQLFEEQRDEDSSYAVPSGIPASHSEIPSNDDDEAVSSGANLLDWTDVNEELEIMQKDLKRSDTRQLLAELGDFDLENNPPRQPDGQNIFSDDPFFSTSTPSPDAFGDGTKDAFSPVAEKSANADPFFPVSDSFSTNASELTTTEGSSNNFGAAFDSCSNNNAFSNSDAFAPAQQEVKTSNSQAFLSEVGDLFSTSSSQSQATAQFGNTWSTSFAGTGSEQQFPTLQPTSNGDSLFASVDSAPSVGLQPEKLSESSKGNADPFAALTGDISDIRGTLPTAIGSNVPQFPKKKPASPMESARVLSPGPSLQPGASVQPTQGPFGAPGMGQQVYPNMNAGGFAQANPFSQSNMQYNNSGYSARMNVPPIPSRPDMPPIPARQDLLQGNGLQSMQQQQQYTPPIPKPYNQSHTGSSSYTTSLSPTPPQPTADPFAGLGGAFSMNQTTTAQEPLYAVVDKSQKKNQTAGQGNSDLFGVFDVSKPVNGTSTSTVNSNEDPFGFGL